MIRTVLLLATTAAIAFLAGCGRPSESTTETPPPSADYPPPSPAPQMSGELAARVAALPAPYSAGDPGHGHIVFARCQICHKAVPGGDDMIGPNLSGVIGRKAGSKPGFVYSDGLKAAGFTWTPQRIDTWLTNPRAMIPGTKMSFAGLSDAKDRADVIAYLATQAPLK